jgi:predicted permease
MKKAMTDLRQDLRFAIRTFRSNPGFTLVVVLTLALGIGANTAIFGLMDQLLVRSLPVPHPERLVVLDAPGPYTGSTHSNSDTLTPLSHPMFVGLSDRNAVFSGVLALFAAPLHITAGSTTERVSGNLVSGTFFTVLGVKPAAGRLFTPEDDVVPGGHPVVVLSHGFWERRFGREPRVVGSTLLVNGNPMTVMGVSESGFRGTEVGQPVDVFVPLMMQALIIPTWTRGLGDWRARWVTVMARLRDGVSLEEARSGIGVLYKQLLREDLETVQTTSESYRERFLQKELALLAGGRGTSVMRDRSRTPLLALMVMVGLVLTIACANVANLLLARASSRRKEIALRVALGASRGRLVRQLLLESLILALAGGAVGILLATWTGDLLLSALPIERVSEAFSAEPDLRVLLFAFLVSLGTGLAFGAAPSLQATHTDLASTFKNETGTLSGRSGASRFRRGLVVAQVALSLLLLIGAGLFVRSLRNVAAIDPGFEPEGLLTFSTNPALNGYALDRRLEVIRRIRDEIAAEPGVISVSLAEVPLMTDSNSSTTVSVEGYEPKEGENMNPNNNGVGPGFFSTLGMRLVSGRDFGEGDTAQSAKVAVVNEGFARYFFGERDPLGRRFLFRRNSEDIVIVGVVADGKSASLREEPDRFVYFPYAQSADLGAVTYYVRSAVRPEDLANRIRALMAEVDATLPVTDMKTMPAQIRESLFVERLVAALSIAFGILATLLAALGIYGLMSYAVAQRTREIGIRVALGAQGRGVLLMVLEEVLLLTFLGVAVGLPSGFALGRLVESELYGLSARDPMTLLAATTSLLAAAILAGYLPAARASRVDPIVALRHE